MFCKSAIKRLKKKNRCKYMVMKLKTPAQNVSERHEIDKKFFIFAIDKKKQIWYNITLYYNSVLCRQ